MYYGFTDLSTIDKKTFILNWFSHYQDFFFPVSWEIEKGFNFLVPLVGRYFAL